MQAKEAAESLGITQRMLRHYENEGLMEIARAENGYRHYSATDLRRAARIRDFVAIGFSTREIRAMRACLSDEGAGPCEGGIDKLLEKLEHIDRLKADLDERRTAVLERLQVLRKGLSLADTQNEPPVAVADRLASRYGHADTSHGEPGQNHTTLD
ncbi:MerR family transcriptional regulator [uncultured Roseibium sp.]|uniref:MerR family transcriptional regulator n=1 Tax=uncultured Roseibium sp. TaxID=1936171 RepID=UPI0026289F95|nr:MerR family transcriptional regulator [uncultured Roseibium sp.]